MESKIQDYGGVGGGGGSPGLAECRSGNRDEVLSDFLEMMAKRSIWLIFSTVLCISVVL